MTAIKPLERGQVVQLLVVLAVIVACLAWVVARVDLDTLTVELRGFDVRWLSGVAALYAAIFVMRVRRAQLLLPPGLRFAPFAPVVAVGFLANAVVPLRLGVLVRPWLMERRCDVPFGVAVTGALAERVVDLLVLLVLLGIVATVAAPPTEVALFEAARASVAVGAVVSVTGLSAVVLTPASWLERLLVPLTSLGRVGDGVAALVRRVAEGARSLAETPLRTLEALGWSVVMWGCGMLASALIMRGFDVWEGTSSVFGFWTGVMAAAAAAPTPASVGPFEAAGTAVLEAYGMVSERAAAVTVVMHLMMFGMNLLIGGTSTAILFSGGLRDADRDTDMAADPTHD
jgi:uncharacterized membrane protein YbhN (UPF0104 family)